MAVDADAAEGLIGTSEVEEYPESGSVMPDLGSRHVRSPKRIAIVTGLIGVLGVGSLCGWLGVEAHQASVADEERSAFVQVARQGAINLTTIDYNHADADVRRILDSATGTFYDDFESRAAPFIDVVKQAKSTSVGTVVDAGLESIDGDAAAVLVSVNVKTTTADGVEQQPRSWRMRVSVQKMGDEMKVSNVAFVP